MEKKEPKHHHGGHRQRLTETIINAGLDKVSDVVALEFILTYVIPRADTNELAHKLLDKFGNLVEVLNADPNLLAEVEGMGEMSAKKLHLFVDIFDYYTEKLLAKRYSFKYRGQMADYFESLLRFRSVETTYIVGVDAAYRVKACYKLAVGGLLSVGISTHQIAKFITSIKPAFVVLAHNHPQGSAEPSQGDLEGTELVENLVNSLGVKLVDHLIVGIDGVYSVKGSNYYREFIPNKKEN